MRWPQWQARLAATTEIGAGLLMALGLLTPLAAAGMIGVMMVAIVVDHWKVGFFIFKPNQGWEYCASIAVDRLRHRHDRPGRVVARPRRRTSTWHGWTGASSPRLLGVGGAVAQLAVLLPASLAA